MTDYSQTRFYHDSEARPYRYGSAAFAALMLVVSFLTLPFLMNWRTGLVPGWYLESIALALALGVVGFTALSGSLKTLPPLLSWLWVGLALYVSVQARLMELPFVGQSDLAAVIFVGMALLTWAAQGLNLRFGTEKVAETVAWALVFGVLLQSVVCAAQFLDYAKATHGLILYLGNTDMAGQLGQRNHLGHYMMWGVLAVCYLWSVRQMRAWLAVPLLLWLLAVVGLIASRTILTYTVAVGALMLVWRLRAGQEARRQVVITVAVLLAVVSAQLAMPWLMQHMGFNANSGLERISSSNSAIDGARRFEWAKAWLAIRERPLWGYGWGGQSLQSFEKDQYFDIFTTHHSSVLFTNNHNFILQIWVELGAVGAAAVITALILLFFAVLRLPLRRSNVFYFGLITVSLCHSMLEYPLWYVYFLAPFCLYLGLIQVELPRRTFSARLPGYIVAAVAAFGIGYSAYYAHLYQRVNQLAGSAEKQAPDVTLRQVNDLLAIARQHRFLDYAASMALLDKINLTAPNVPAWAPQVARHVAEYRPYAAHAPIWGLLQYRTGDKAAALKWLEMTWHYYPVYLPQYVTQIHDSDYFSGLYPPAIKACLNYYQQHPEIGDCKVEDSVLETN